MFGRFCGFGGYYGDNGFYGSNFGYGFLIQFLFLILMVVIVYLLIKRLNNRDTKSQNSEAKEIAKARYARGEISQDEYKNIVNTLKK